MAPALTPREFKAWVGEAIAPYADQWDREERLPDGLLRALAGSGFPGASIPRDHGGGGLDALAFGALCEALGGGSASVLSLLTVHGMVAEALLKWGNDAQKDRWLPRLAAGETFAAFALTEPNVGCDAKNIETTAELRDGGWVLNGEKAWVSGGQVAGLFLVFAQCAGRPAAFLVERDSPGLSVEPVTGLLGFRAAMLARVRLNDCRIPAESLLGRAGFGFSHVAGTALNHGRYCIAWGCAGMAAACLAASLDYAGRRRQFGVLLREHQLIQRLLTDMVTGVKAARLLCRQAGTLREQGDPRAIMETAVAKYFASRAASRAAADAVQIHGANGCGGDYPVQRYLRDAKIMEIIEGSTQMQQLLIAGYGYQGLGEESP